jgi:hypothetical protein
VSTTTTLSADVARYVELTLAPRRARLTEQERLRRPLEARLRVVADTVESLPDGTPPTEVAKLIRQLAGIEARHGR